MGLGRVEAVGHFAQVAPDRFHDLEFLTQREFGNFSEAHRARRLHDRGALFQRGLWVKLKWESRKQKAEMKRGGA
jgi:hypothetical protein